MDGCQLLKIWKQFAKLYKLVSNDHQPILKMMKNKLQINQKLITQILHKEWGKKNRVKFVPHGLMYWLILS